MYALLLTVTLTSTPAPNFDVNAAPPRPRVEVIAEVPVPETRKGPFGGFFRRLFKGRPRPVTSRKTAPLSALRTLFNDFYEESDEETKKWESASRLNAD